MLENMLKKGFLYISVLALMSGAACSSNSSSSGEDLDITEIKEIEATGEFSEDEFFANEGDLALEEEQLVDEVPDLEQDIAGLEETGDAVANDDLSFEVEEDAGATLLEGADLFEDESFSAEDFEEDTAPLAQANENITIEADDLGLGDSFGEEDVISATNSDEGALEFDSDEDLFRDETVDESVTVTNNGEFTEDVQTPDFIADTGEPKASDLIQEDVTIDVDYGNQAASSDSQMTASQLVQEDVTIDVDYGTQASNSEQSASQLLNEDVTIDVDYGNSGSGQTVAQTSTKSYVPVKKMKTIPYTKNGVLVNAIYFVRAGDTLDSIAGKIYGRGSDVNFRIVNPHLKAGGLRVGQKVYYNSPQRPRDQSRLLTYYEDVRVPVQTYTAAQGENIRKISKDILGHERSWMEIWASNQQIQSKWDLEAPYSIRYWEGSAPAPAAPVLAQVKTPPPTSAPEPEMDLEPEPSTAQANLNLSEPEESEVDMAVNDPVLDEPQDDMDMGLDSPDMEMDSPAQVAQEEENFDDMAFEEEPAPVAEEPMVAEENMDDGRDIARNQGGAFPAKSQGGLLSPDNTRLMALAGGALLLLLLGFIIIRKRRASAGEPIEMESFDFGGDTTIEEAQTKTQIDL